VRAARSTLFVGLPFPLPKDKDFFLELQKASQRGVRVRIMVPRKDQIPAPLVDQLGEVRTGPIPARVLFMDDRQVCIVFKRPRQAGDHEYRAIWNPHADLVEHMQDISHVLWEAAGKRPGDLDSDEPHSI
jgi:hypothetical protein